MSWLFSLGNIPYSLNKAKNWHRNIVQRFKDGFCQWPATLLEGSHQSSISTEDETDFVSFFLSKLEHTRNFTRMKMMPDLPQYKLWEYQYTPESFGHRNPVEGAKLRPFLRSLSLRFSTLVPFSQGKRLFLLFLIRQAENTFQFTCQPLLMYFVNSRHSYPAHVTSDT